MGDYSGWAINRSNKFNVKITICRIVALGGFAADPGSTPSMSSIFFLHIQPSVPHTYPLFQKYC
jgi:hypothetical protein